MYIQPPFAALVMQIFLRKRRDHDVAYFPKERNWDFREKLVPVYAKTDKRRILFREIFSNAQTPQGFYAFE